MATGQYAGEGRQPLERIFFPFFLQGGEGQVVQCSNSESNGCLGV
jgi:hypothetical protein